MALPGEIGVHALYVDLLGGIVVGNLYPILGAIVLLNYENNQGTGLLGQPEKPPRYWNNVLKKRSAANALHGMCARIRIRILEPLYYLLHIF